MKKLLALFLLALLCVSSFAQTVTLTFTGRDAKNNHCQLNRVAITNLTKSWQETIYYPDTTLIMQVGTGIDDYAVGDVFTLSQNNPNPFNGTTEANLTVVEPGDVSMEISDVNSRIVETQNFASLQTGNYRFRIQVSAVGIYFMTARQRGQSSTIKMVNNGGGSENSVEFVGLENKSQALPQTKSSIKGATNNPFSYGDQMEYVSYATFNGTEVESDRIQQMQGASQTFTLQFNAVQAQLPTVITEQVTSIASNSATCGGNVTADGGATVIDRGICYNTTGTPTILDNCEHSGAGVGSFSQNLTGLSTGTTYYVRAFAINSVGVAYGAPVQFTTTTYQLPTVTTSAVTNIGLTSATCGGNVIDDGGYSVLARGICWSTQPNPVFNDSHTSDGSGTGSFSSNITGLSFGTTCYVRAYAVSSVGTAYGNEVSFTTISDGLPCSGTATLTDVDGNVYNTAQIGNQCWMKENLRTTKYADGTNISLGSDTSTIMAYRYCPNNDASNVATYGYLYNWKAVMRNSSSSSGNPSGVQGICPTGWHVPSDAEWTQLTNYVSSQSEYLCGSSSSYIAKALASTTGWYSSSYTCDVGNDPSTNNATGFSAVPAGDYYYDSYRDFGYDVYFWSSTEGNSYYAYFRDLYYRAANVLIGGLNKGCGFSVRCLKDDGRPTVFTSTIANVTLSSATCGGNVTADGGNVVAARGVCWSTSPTPTISDSHTSDGTGIGSFISNMTGLTAYTTYYVRAYATNSMGDFYGDELVFTTNNDGQPCPNAATLTDVDGNVYNTVRIGTQCWMKENLRTTKYADGTSIALGSSTSTSTAYRYYPNNSSSNVSTYGYLYNWNAVMGNSSSSNNNPSGVQGICPTGWHVPSAAEWTQLTNYVSSQSEYVCGSETYYIAKALASTTGWYSYTETCAVGNDPSTNNATGFSALPAGSYYGSYDDFGYDVKFWSSTEDYSYDAYGRYLFYDNPNVLSTSFRKYYGFSVRCLRD